MTVTGYQEKQRNVREPMSFGQRCLYLVPMFLVMGTIFFLSSQPGDTLSLPDIADLDKFLHAGIYGVLAASTLFAVQGNRWRARPRVVAVFVVLFCVLYGLSDEWHQSFVPGRTPDILDLAADTVGAAIMVLLWLRCPWCTRNPGTTDTASRQQRAG